MRLIYSARSLDQVIYRKELERLGERIDRKVNRRIEVAQTSDGIDQRVQNCALRHAQGNRKMAAAILDVPHRAHRRQLVEAVGDRPLAGEQVAAGEPAAAVEGDPGAVIIGRRAADDDPLAAVAHPGVGADLVGDRVAHDLDLRRPCRRLDRAQRQSHEKHLLIASFPGAT